MFAYLQFSSDNVTYYNIGAIRPFSGQDYQINPVTANDRENKPQVLGYRVSCRAQARSLHASFSPDQTQYYFRLYYTDYYKGEDFTLDLGQQNFVLNYDGAIPKQSAKYNNISIEFYIGQNEYDTYILPRNTELFEFTVSGVTVTPTAGAVYESPASNEFTVISTEISAGSGTIFTERTSGSSNPGTPPNTLDKVSGTGDNQISYSAYTTF